MNVNVYLENSLNKEIVVLAKKLHKSRNAIVREALKEWVSNHRTEEWPTLRRNFKGIPTMTSFEAHRKELKSPKEDPFE